MSLHFSTFFNATSAPLQGCVYVTACLYYLKKISANNQESKEEYFEINIQLLTVKHLS